LVLRYQDLAYGVAYRIMQSDQAADVTQMAFISAFRKINQFHGGNFKAWLMRIVTNACYDELRRLKRRPTASLDDLESESDGLAFDTNPQPAFVGEMADPEASFQKTELQALIEACIEALGEHHKLVVILADIEQYSYEDIAQIAEISLGTVKSRLSRARASLRDCLRQHRELLPEQYRLEE
jgi:RNA polymerase sigma-70 factor (ECF subfamily)